MCVLSLFSPSTVTQQWEDTSAGGGRGERGKGLQPDMYVYVYGVCTYECIYVCMWSGYQQCREMGHVIVQ